MTAVMFFAGGWGYLQLLRLPAAPGQPTALPADGGSLLSNSTALLALAAVVAAAVLAGVLAAVPWFSPLASGLPGVLLLAWTAVYLVSVRRAVEFIPLRSHAFGAGWEGLLFNGILGAVGAVMVFPMFIPARWRGRPRVETDVFTSDVDDYLAAVKTDDRPGRREERRREERAEHVPLIGTLVGGRPTDDGVRPVDTTRITGASRALRNTGSFRAATGAQPRATGAFRAATGAQPRATGSQPRATGFFRSAQDTSLLRRPYYQAGDE
jgi:hypothetical protein